jgi:hypothetical protein
MDKNRTSMILIGIGIEGKIIVHKVKVEDFEGL